MSLRRLYRELRNVAFRRRADIRFDAGEFWLTEDLTGQRIWIGRDVTVHCNGYTLTVGKMLRGAGPSSTLVVNS